MKTKKGFNLPWQINCEAVEILERKPLAFSLRKIMSLYSTNKLTETAVEEIKEALHELQYGSVEIYVQGGIITQITKRIIKKTIPSNTKRGLDNNIKNR